MVIKYQWVTARKVKYHLLNTEWEGWFLFGIIPLYIRSLSRQYLDRP